MAMARGFSRVGAREGNDHIDHSFKAWSRDGMNWNELLKRLILGLGLPVAMT